MPAFSSSFLSLFSVLLLSYPGLVFAEENVLRDLNALNAQLEQDAGQVRHLDLGDETDPEKWIKLVRQAKALETLVVSGPDVRDRHMDDFAKLTELNYLILDCTEVMDEAVAEFEKRRPDVTIYRSQRWANRKLAEPLPRGGISRPVFRGGQLDEINPDLTKLLGKSCFWKNHHVNYTGLPDIELGPWEPITSEQLYPLKYLTDLTWLELGPHCKLTDKVVLRLDGLTQLKRFRLPSLKWKLVRITDRAYKVLENFRELEILTCEVNDETIRHLAHLTKLKEIFLSNSEELTDEGLRHTRNLNELKTVYLKNTKIKGEGLRHLAGCKSLETLRMNDSQLEEINSLPSLPSLKYLVLSNTLLTDNGLNDLSKFPNLEVFGLSGTDITDQSVPRITSIKTLKTVTLAGTDITVKCLEHFEDCEQLEVLQINGTAIDWSMDAARTVAKIKPLRRLIITTENQDVIDFLESERGIEEIELRN